MNSPSLPSNVPDSSISPTHGLETKDRLLEVCVPILKSMNISLSMIKCKSFPHDFWRVQCGLPLCSYWVWTLLYHRESGCEPFGL